MTNSLRPARNIKQDKNHRIVSNALRDRCGGCWKDDFNVWHAHIEGVDIAAIDTSKFGGEMLDWLVQVEWLTIYFEVKIIGEEKSLKPGEIAFFKECPAPAYVVTDSNEVYNILNAAAKFVLFTDYRTVSPSMLQMFLPPKNADQIAIFPDPTRKPEKAGPKRKPQAA